MVSGSHTLYLAFLALIVVERLYELARSGRNERALLARGGREIGRRHHRVMVLFHSAFLLSCAAEVVGLGRPFPGPLGWVALGGAAVAQVLRYWAATTLGERWTTRVVILPGAPPITGGPYRWVRHPNYSAVILEMACIPLIHGAIVTALVFSVGNALLLLIRVRAEEAALGPRYAQTFARRPRFVPGGER